MDSNWSSGRVGGELESRTSAPSSSPERIVVLVNQPTHSAAQIVASFAKQNRLAALVGTRTAGEVLGGANFKLPGGYILRMPVAGWYTWQGECIEGNGVEPDFRVENSPQSLAAGVDCQLDGALEVVKSL